MEEPKEVNREEQRPSEVTDEEWVWAKRPDDESPSVNKEKRGKWCLLRDKGYSDINGECELDVSWRQIKKRVADGMLYNCKCSTAFESPNLSEDTGVIICFTPDFENIDDVRRVADVVRNSVRLDKPMYYKTESASQTGLHTARGHTNISLYKYTEYGQMYQRSGNTWKILAQETPSLEELGGDLRPSEITHLEWVHAKMPGEIPYEDDGGGGKWCLFQNKTDRDDNGDSKLDVSWRRVKRLVEDAVLYDCKCSTGFRSPKASRDESSGVIVCYTPDYQNIDDVRRVADAIREVVKLRTPMYYKTESDTDEGLYSYRGHSRISIYKYTEEGEMYVRDKRGWALLEKGIAT